MEVNMKESLNVTAALAFDNMTEDVTPSMLYNTSTEEGYYNYDYNDTYAEYYYGENEPHFLKVFRYEIWTLGIVRPFLIFITTVANCFVVGFFMTKKNRGRATNILFVSIAFSDTMTGILLLPNSFYVYVQMNDHLTTTWCNIYMLTKLYFSPVFHTVSIWQTVLLCIQRYMCVCHPFISSRVCTPGKTILSIAVMYCMASVLHVYHLVDEKAIDVPPICAWLTGEECTGKCVYLWFSVVLQHLLPCFILILLTAVTLLELEKAKIRLSSMSSRCTQTRSSRDRIITITATLVVIVFLVPELPQGIYKLVLTVHLHEKLGLEQDLVMNHFILSVYEILLLVSFHANFWIYCAMMHDFRDAFFKFITCGSFKRGMNRLRKLSGSFSYRKSSVNTTFSRTSSEVGRNRIQSQTTSLHSMNSDSLHAVIPLSPTKNTKPVFSRSESIDEQNDDVFV